MEKTKSKLNLTIGKLYGKALRTVEHGECVKILKYVEGENDGLIVHGRKDISSMMCLCGAIGFEMVYQYRHDKETDIYVCPYCRSVMGGVGRNKE